MERKEIVSNTLSALCRAIHGEDVAGWGEILVEEKEGCLIETVF